MPFPAKQLLTHSAGCLTERAEFFEKLLEYCLTIDDFSEKLYLFLRVPRKIHGNKINPSTVARNVIPDLTIPSNAQSSNDMQGQDQDQDQGQGNVKPDRTQIVMPVSPPSTETAPSLQSRKFARRSKRGSVYFKNLMAEVDIDSILEKNELTDEELLMLSRRQSNAHPPSGAVSELFKLTFQELQEVYTKLTSDSKDDNSGGMSCEQFMKWEEIENVVASGVLTAESIQHRFVQFIDKKPSGISERNFQLLVNQLDLSGVNKEGDNSKGDGPHSRTPSQLNDQMSSATVFLLRSTLRAHYLFDALSAEDITALLADMSPLTVEQGQHIIEQNERGDLFFCIEKGTAIASVIDMGVVKSYGSGDSFGELALLHECPRSATVTATTDCKLWTLGLRSFRSVASSSSSKKIGRRREASAANKRISKRGSIVCVPPSQDVPISGTESVIGKGDVDDVDDVEVTKEVQEEVVTDTEGDFVEEDVHHIPDEIKEIYEELSKESDGEGVSLSAIVSWSVMQDAIQCAFMSEIIMWNEFVALVSERKKKQSTRSSISGNDLLKLDAFYRYCVKLQQIIDTNIEMMESIDQESS